MAKCKHTFSCHACKNTFDLLIDKEEQPVITGYCPYCKAEWEADLSPSNSTIEIFKGGQSAAHSSAIVPDIIVTTPPPSP